MTHYSKFLLNKGRILALCLMYTTKTMFKLLAFWRKQTHLIDQKCTYEKATKNSGKFGPPSFGQNPKDQKLFFGTPSLTLYGAFGYWAQLIRWKCSTEICVERILEVTKWYQILIGFQRYVRYSNSKYKMQDGHFKEKV